MKAVGLVVMLWLMAALPGLAEIRVEGAYARAASPAARSGAAFMVIVNEGAAPDRLVAVRSDVAARTELHTHVDGGDGVMRMRPVEGGIAVPAQGEARLARGGDHVMFMGLTAPFVDGTELAVTLVFEQAGEVAVTIPVDNTRAPEADGGHGTAGDAQGGLSGHSGHSGQGSGSD